MQKTAETSGGLLHRQFYLPGSFMAAGTQAGQP